jgi:hypothetical protein
MRPWTKEEEEEKEGGGEEGDPRRPHLAGAEAAGELPPLGRFHVGVEGDSVGGQHCHTPRRRGPLPRSAARAAFR